MVDDSTPAGNGGDSPGTAADRLNSWKEIAAYLGKGVRTVQRWEAHMGLPVRRLGREGGEIVYALKSEIDAWILNGGHAAAANQSPDIREAPPETASPEVRDEVAPPSPAPTRFLAPRWVWAVLLLIGLAGIGMTLGQRNGGGRAMGGRNPVGAAYEGGVLHAWDSEGESLWRTPIGAPAGTRLDTRINLDPAGNLRRIAVEDLDGDGINEVLLITISASGSGDGLRVFNADGTQRFSHVPGRPVTFGSTAYAGFNTNALYTFRDADGAPGLWVTAAHVPFFPSLLQRLSPRGEVLSEYWSNGHIRTIRPALFRGRPFLLVGSYNNERHGASLAFLDVDHPSGTAPSEKPEYRCRDCAEGGPTEFLVFPSADVLEEATQSQGSAVVLDARLTGWDDLAVTVSQASANVPGEAKPIDGTINYTLSATDLSLRAVLPGWGYLSIHRTFERAGRMSHAFGPRDEAALGAVVRWNQGRFVPLGARAQDPALARQRETPPGRTGS